METNANNSERKPAAHQPRKTQTELLQLIGFQVRLVLDPAGLLKNLQISALSRKAFA
jgi:hypothetical protein